MPAGKTLKVGVWENGQYIGCVIFARGSNKHIGTPYRLTQMQACELVRVALNRHESTVSRVVAVALRLLKRSSEGIRLVVSYADPREGHHGGIYQAGNWLYAGPSTGNDKRNHPYRAPGGRIVHWRTMSGICGRKGMPHTEESAANLGYEPLAFIAKHKYLMPLDAKMRKQIEPLRKPYPKRAGSDTGDTPTVQVGKGGPIPTSAL